MADSRPRRLRGHTATATCCIASRDRPGFVATSGEDGRVCCFDMRCKDAVCIMDISKEPISSLCFKQGNENIIYVSTGKEVKSFDVHQATSWKPLETYNFNKEEINQVSCGSKSNFLAAADDGGDVKIIDIQQHCVYKTLRAGHTSFRFVAAFNFFLGDLGKLVHVQGKFRGFPNLLKLTYIGVITGGLDSKLIMWDFSRGRPYKTIDFGLPEKNSSVSGGGQCFNPAFVHAIVVPEVDMLDKLGHICVVAKGDGTVNVIDIKSELGSEQSKSSKKAGRSKTRSNDFSTDEEQAVGKSLQFDYSIGGHTAGVSCVAFSQFGEIGKFIISGGNDKFVKVWNWPGFSEAGDNSNLLQLNIEAKKKVNWLCTTPSETENLVVCDTTKVVKVYSIL